MARGSVTPVASVQAGPFPDDDWGMAGASWNTDENGYADVGLEGDDRGSDFGPEVLGKLSEHRSARKSSVFPFPSAGDNSHLAKEAPAPLAFKGSESQGPPSASRVAKRPREDGGRCDAGRRPGEEVHNGAAEEKHDARCKKMSLWESDSEDGKKKTRKNSKKNKKEKK